MGILHYSDRQKGIVVVVWDGQTAPGYESCSLKIISAYPRCELKQNQGLYEMLSTNRPP